jgi:hypothetical protein
MICLSAHKKDMTNGIRSYQSVGFGLSTDFRDMGKIGTIQRRLALPLLVCEKMTHSPF